MLSLIAGCSTQNEGIVWERALRPVSAVSPRSCDGKSYNSLRTFSLAMSLITSQDTTFFLPFLFMLRRYPSSKWVMLRVYPI